MKRQFTLKGKKNNRYETIKCVENKKNDIDVYLNNEFDIVLKTELIMLAIKYLIESADKSWLYCLEDSDTLEAFLVASKIYFDSEPKILSISDDIDIEGIFTDDTEEIIF